LRFPTFRQKKAKGWGTGHLWNGNYAALWVLMMSYAVKEIFYTLQGEGAQTGRAAVFCRFAGCNLWSGRESDRRLLSAGFAIRSLVGVDVPGGGKFDSAEDLAVAIERTWPENSGQNGSRLGKRFVVCTGGEPLLQLDTS